MVVNHGQRAQCTFTHHHGEFPEQGAFLAGSDTNPSHPDAFSTWQWGWLIKCGSNSTAPLQMKCPFVSQQQCPGKGWTWHSGPGLIKGADQSLDSTILEGFSNLGDSGIQPATLRRCYWEGQRCRNPCIPWIQPSKEPAHPSESQAGAALKYKNFYFLLLFLTSQVRVSRFHFLLCSSRLLCATHPHEIFGYRMPAQVPCWATPCPEAFSNYCFSNQPWLL